MSTPTADEWTRQWGDILCDGKLVAAGLSVDQAELVISAHNASIAASWSQVVSPLQAELAAERDAFAAKNPTSFVRIERVQELLADEREKHKRFEQIYRENPSLYKLAEEVVELREQLDAATDAAHQEILVLQQQLTAEQDRHSKTEREKAQALWQIQMDTECIERVRNQGMKMEAQRDELRDQLAAEREASEGARAAQRHMNACRGLLKVPEGEVLYDAIEELQQQLETAKLEAKQFAAERERCERGLCKGAALFAGKEAETIQQLREQLAAVVKLLNEISREQSLSEEQLAALPKIQDGK